ncbi:glycosyl hydrolase family 18 protein [Streptomyces sp. 1331.2]|uniref:glycosyl hydrolase family 18 protein n=1 Tax=Streptomyces sp. 1331.2 TaxID=1938835 RepID=UPI000BC37A48|nr:glycosyl hydrolase family 18 protein [Streptomyces sp. 1331.2]SOB84961.1 Glycosyl hydrolases family 18 [Streptomyces sp. 1331.2]
MARFRTGARRIGGALAVPFRALRDRWRGWSWWRRTLLVLVLAAAVPATALGSVFVTIRLHYTGEPPAEARTRGRDALWLGHAWVDGRKTETDVAGLVHQLAGTGIRDLYVHTGPLEHDGTLPPAVHPRARWFADTVHRELPGVRVQSWLGDEVKPEKDAMDLEDAPTRDRVTASARQVLDLGFDGVHFDMEPIRPGSAGWLALLDQVRPVTAARGAKLSVAAPQIDPVPGLHTAGILLTDHGKWWDGAYFAATARRVDQVAVMTYDTSMPTAPLYGGYVAQQTELALQATPADVDLLIGLPFYWDDKWGHWGDAETVPAAVRGVRLGLGREDPRRANFGVALYVDFASTPGNWADYRSGWVDVR